MNNKDKVTMTVSPIDENLDNYVTPETISDEAVKSFIENYSPFEAGQLVVLNIQAEDVDTSLVACNLGKVPIKGTEYIILGVFNSSSVESLLSSGQPISIDTLLAERVDDHIQVINQEDLPKSVQDEMNNEKSDFTKNFAELMNSESVQHYGNTLLHANLTEFVEAYPEYKEKYDGLMEQFSQNE